MPPITPRIDHFAIAAADTAAIIAWYHRVLGLVVHAQTQPAPDQPQLTYLIGPPAAPGAALHQGMMIEVMPQTSAPRHLRHHPRDPGLSHVAWYVPDFDCALQHLKNQNVSFLSEILQAVGGGRIVSFADNEGNMMQIVERKA